MRLTRELRPDLCILDVKMPVMDGIAAGRFREMSGLEAEVDDLAGRLEARKLVDRAKGLLMDKEQMSESEAFRFVQKQAMQRRQTMKQVAEQIISQYEG